MIYTVTFNPAVDYVVRLDSFCAGQVNRTVAEQIFFGGKGINVSIVLSQLGITSRALGFCAGFTGSAIEDGVKAQGIETDFVHLEKGNSRINVKIKADEESEINGQGPEISQQDIDKLFEKLDKIKDGDTIILAGSIPKTLPDDIYEKILSGLSDRKVNTIVDATKDLLVNVLKYKPFLIKPNNFELGEIFGKVPYGPEEISLQAKKLQEMGARNVLVSMAGDGSLLVTENGDVLTMGVCKGKVKNSVGAGDSMVAGFTAGMITENDYLYALKLGTACGGATAFSDGLCKKDDIMKLLSELDK